MKFHLVINSIKTIYDTQDFWTNEDYLNLLELFDYSDAKNTNSSELREVLEMAISDF
jgi:hypothetical protein